jgi:ribosomal protein L37AE/L43A
MNGSLNNPTPLSLNRSNIKMCKKANHIKFEITVKGIWKCPHCGTLKKIEYNGNPYSKGNSSNVIT